MRGSVRWGLAILALAAWGSGGCAAQRQPALQVARPDTCALLGFWTYRDVVTVRRPALAVPSPPESTPPFAAPDPEAVVDYQVVEAAIAAFRASPGDGQKLARALAAIEAFVDRYASKPERAGELRVEAAYLGATLRKEAGDASCRGGYAATVEAFRALRGAVARPPGWTPAPSRAADRAAESALVLLEERVRGEWDGPSLPPGRFAYAGNYDAVEPQVVADEQTRESLFVALESIRAEFPSAEALPRLFAREGSLYDTHRAALLRASVGQSVAHGQALRAVIARANTILADPSASRDDREKARGRLELARALLVRLPGLWAESLRARLFDVEMRLIQRYAAAVLRARRIDLVDPAVTAARARLSALTASLGNPRLREFLDAAPASRVGAEWALAYPLSFKYVDDLFR